ncbi:MAG: hypothetical protein JW873_02845 [Candidatus Saganbacteria bacterium]|nr:hypothetical protein [Candidatus Saganbacteria bacterium]
MEARIDARIIYQPLARRLGVSAAKIAVALRRAEIAAADHTLSVGNFFTYNQAKVAAGILNFPEARLNELYSVTDVPLAEPGTIFGPYSLSIPANPGKKSVPLYDPSVPVRVPYKIYGSWVFNFQDGRSETVSGGQKLTGEQMLLVRQSDRRGVRRTHDCVDEMDLDREGLSVEFTEGERGVTPEIIPPLADYLAGLNQRAGIAVEKGLLIGSLGWGCSVGGDDVDFVLIADVADGIGPAQLERHWTGNDGLALRVNSTEHWRQAEKLRTEFLSVPENDYDATGFYRFSAAYRGKYPNQVLNLAWYSDFIEVEPSAGREKNEIVAPGSR